MPEPAEPKAADALWVLLGKAATSAAVLATGFRALSDDDFARVVIAERFAAAPSWDPSGTSWLPLPFWLNGVVMLAARPSVATAQATAIALGLASALGVFVAARWLGLERRAALAGALVGCTLPYAAWLGVATVPEAPTAALTLLGAASLTKSGRVRVVGALALAAACLCRYEAWPVAAAFALFTGVDAVRARDRTLGLAALAAVAAPLGWLAHGALHHGNALFFVARVSEYRRALGAGHQPVIQALTNYPLMLLRCEPEVVALALLGAAALYASRQRAAFRRWARPEFALGALLVFLVVGDLRDGAPTHHGERALLAIWLGLALFAADTLVRSAPELTRRARAALTLGGSVLLGVALLVVRPWYARRDSFVDRSAELAIGEAARRAAAPGERLLVDSPDFGYFAVIAGFGAPDRAEPFDDHDPRKPRPTDAFASAGALRERIAREHAVLVVTHGEHASVAEALATRVEEREGLGLYRFVF